MVWMVTWPSQPPSLMKALVRLRGVQTIPSVSSRDHWHPCMRGIYLTLVYDMRYIDQ